MTMIRECGKENINPANIYRYIRFRSRFHVNHPDYFDADGILCFVGPQGSGKTLSAVNYIYKLLKEYPKVKICTNVLLTDYPIVYFDDWRKKNECLADEEKKKEYATEKYITEWLFQLYIKMNRVFPFINNDDFVRYYNGEQGFIFFVDEIQLYMNSLESKNINMDTVTQISQQRKQRKHIVGTSQVFGRMAKPLREQFSNVVLCKNYFGCIQKNSLIDRESLDKETSSDTTIEGKVKKNFWWIHNPDVMYKRYDTYYVIEKGKFVSGDEQKVGVYNDNDIKLSISS